MTEAIARPRLSEQQQAWLNILVGDDGWFHEDGKATVAGVFADLLGLGISEDAARDMVERIVLAVRSEYGE